MLTYNTELSTPAIDQYNTPQVIGNMINDRIHYIQKPENNIIIPVNNTYKFRPERLALEQYGDELLYPIILASNNIGSIFDFDPTLFNNEIKLLKPEIVRNVLQL